MKRLMFIFVVSWTMLSIPYARAAEPSVSSPSETSVEKARISFQQGVRLFHEGSFEAAIAEFQKAYRLSPTYRIFYNIAQAYSEKHDYVSAITALKQYRDDGKDDLTAIKRSQIEEQIKEFESRIAYLTIHTNVEGAEIRIDGISVGQSPLPFPIPVNAGPRKISAHKMGLTSVVHNVMVTGSEKHNISLDLPNRGSSTERAALLENTPSISMNTVNQPPTRSALIVSLVATGVCVVATGIAGYATLQAKHDFEADLNTYPANKDRIDSARSKLSTYAAITDGLGAAAIIAGGLSVYFALANPFSSGPSRATTSHRSVAIVPTLDGMALYGQW